MHVTLMDKRIAITRECARLRRMVIPYVNAGRDSPDHSVMIPSCRGCIINIAVGIQNDIWKNIAHVILYVQNTFK